MTAAKKKKSADAKGKKTSTARKKLDVDQVLTQVVSFLVRHSPKELTFSKISRWTKVPRSTLYYYFGSSIDGLVEEAARFAMKEFVGLHKFDKDIQSQSWDEFQKHRLRRVLKLVVAYPWAPVLYFRYRTDAGPIGEVIRTTEKKYLEEFQKSWNHFEGKKPDFHSVRLTAYLKLGLLFGLAMESDYWSNAEGDPFEDMLGKVTELFRATLETDFQQS